MADDELAIYPKRAKIVVNKQQVTADDLAPDFLLPAGFLGPQFNLQIIPQLLNGLPTGTLQPSTFWFTSNATYPQNFSQRVGNFHAVYDAVPNSGEVVLLRNERILGVPDNAPIIELGSNQGFGPPANIPVATGGGIYSEDGTNEDNGFATIGVYGAALAYAPWNVAEYRYPPFVKAGDWTLTVGDGTNNIALGASVGTNYQVVGRVCTFQLRFRYDTGGIGIAAGTLRVSLPFAALSGATNSTAATLGDPRFITFAASEFLTASISGGQQEIRLWRTSTAANGVTIKVADTDDGVVPGVGRTQMRISGSYFLA